MAYGDGRQVTLIPYRVLCQLSKTDKIYDKNLMEK